MLINRHVDLVQLRAVALAHKHGQLGDLGIGVVKAEAAVGFLADQPARLVLVDLRLKHYKVE